jgi:hypothetical protein
LGAPALRATIRENEKIHFLLLQRQPLAPFAAFAARKNAKRELSFFLTAAREAGQSPKGSKAANPLEKSETMPKKTANFISIPRVF